MLAENVFELGLMAFMERVLVEESFPCWAPFIALRPLLNRLQPSTHAQPTTSPLPTTTLAHIQLFNLLFPLFEGGAAFRTATRVVLRHWVEYRKKSACNCLSFAPMVLNVDSCRGEWKFVFNEVSFGVDDGSRMRHSTELHIVGGRQWVSSHKLQVKFLSMKHHSSSAISKRENLGKILFLFRARDIFFDDSHVNPKSECTNGIKSVSLRFRRRAGEKIGSSFLQPWLRTKNLMPSWHVGYGFMYFPSSSSAYFSRLAQGRWLF